MLCTQSHVTVCKLAEKKNLIIRELNYHCNLLFLCLFWLSWFKELVQCKISVFVCVDIGWRKRKPQTGLQKNHHHLLKFQRSFCVNNFGCLKKKQQRFFSSFGTKTNCVMGVKLVYNLQSSHQFFELFLRFDLHFHFWVFSLFLTLKPKGFLMEIWTKSFILLTYFSWCSCGSIQHYMTKYITLWMMWLSHYRWNDFTTSYSELIGNRFTWFTWFTRIIYSGSLKSNHSFHHCCHHYLWIEFLFSETCVCVLWLEGGVRQRGGAKFPAAKKSRRTWSAAVFFSAVTRRRHMGTTIK